MRKNIIQKALAQAAGGPSNASSVVDATVSAMRLLLVELNTLVGSQASAALFARSVHLTRPSFQWLTQAAADSAEARLVTLRSDLSACDPNEARKTGEALLLTFSDLLVSLIGEPLTHRLLRSAWGIPADDEPSGRKLDE